MPRCPGAHHSTTEVSDLVRATLWLRPNCTLMFKYISSLVLGSHVGAKLIQCDKIIEKSEY